MVLIGGIPDKNISFAYPVKTLYLETALGEQKAV